MNSTLCLQAAEMLTTNIPV